MSLPLFQTALRELSMLQSAWTRVLDPVIMLPTNSGRIIKGVELVIGTNEIDHKLGRKLQGWYTVRKRGVGNFYDTQDTNNNAALTLQLVSDAVVSVDIFVF